MSAICLEPVRLYDPLYGARLGRSGTGSWFWDTDRSYARQPGVYMARAVVGGRTIGMISGRIWRGVFRDYGTLVSKAWRGQGIGTVLWDYVLSRLRPRIVEVSVNSERGSLLVESLRRRWPRIEFLVCDERWRRVPLRKKRRAA